MFIDRHQELAALEQMFQSEMAEFFVLYGRRRVGKTELLTQFCGNLRSSTLPNKHKKSGSF